MCPYRWPTMVSWYLNDKSPYRNPIQSATVLWRYCSLGDAHRIDELTAGVVVVARMRRHVTCQPDLHAPFSEAVELDLEPVKLERAGI